MQKDNPILFVEINESNYIFIAGYFNDNAHLEIIEKIITPNIGLEKNKFTNIDLACKTIRDKVEKIESKLEYVFKDVTVIIESFNFSCVNVSGFKKLNGSQLLKENISYILNSLKSTITESESQKTILHIFNSKSVLDGVNVDNLPIGLFGDFYYHELTFYLIKNNDLKNIKNIFNKCNLNLNKIVLKNFSEGTQLINQNNNLETFFRIKIKKEVSHISFFDQSSFKYSENFNFGTNIIFKDVAKICSIDDKIIKNFISNNVSNNIDFNDSEYLEEKYFINENFRKIRKKLIIDIMKARIEEICNIVYNKNINLTSFKNENIKIFLIIENESIFERFNFFFKSCFSKNKNCEIYLIKDFDIETTIASAAHLSIYGWKKEAIPITQAKTSIISRIFKSMFG